MPSPTDPKKPVPTASPEPSDLLELLDEPTDAVELKVDLTAPEEPVGHLAFDEEPARSDDGWELSAEEPIGTSLLDDDAPARRGPMFVDDLEDFATQEELPILPWSLEADLLQLGRTVRAVLDPTVERSIWTRPDGEPGEVAVTVRLRMLDVSVRVLAVQGSPEVLRVGRDVLAGRALILVG